MKQKILFVLSFFLTAVVITILFRLPRASKTVSPSQPQLDSSPVMMAIQFSPIYDKVVNHGLRTKNKVALTFDADMTPFMLKKLHRGEVASYYNKKVIDILETQKIPATLFITGLWATEYPDVVKQLSQNPLFEIGNHSYSHPRFTKSCYDLPFIRRNQKEDEFKKTQEILKNLIGHEPKLFRFPGGCYEKQDLNLAKKYGLTVVGWDVDGRDAFNVNTQLIIKNIQKEIKPGSIVVLHMHGGKAPQTAEALPQVIEDLKNKNFTFVTVGELLKDLESTPQ